MHQLTCRGQGGHQQCDSGCQFFHEVAFRDPRYGSPKVNLKAAAVCAVRDANCRANNRLRNLCGRDRENEGPLRFQRRFL